MPADRDQSTAAPAALRDQSPAAPRDRRLRVPLPAALASPAAEDEARDLLAQAQAALQDQHPDAVLRALQRLHRLLVPALDAHLQALDPASGDPQRPSCAIGFLTLYQDLADIDPERESIATTLIEAAAQALEAAPPADAAALAPGDDPGRQWQALAARLQALPLPRSRWWPRLARGAAPLPDEARVLVQRGDRIVLERLGAPDPSAPPPSSAVHADSDLGDLHEGDRLTLQVPLAAAGRVAILGAAGDEHQAELTLLLPHTPQEDVPRRLHEIVDIVGEVHPAPGAGQHALVVLWAPDLVPAGWTHRVLAQRRLPPGARLRRYRYQIR